MEVLAISAKLLEVVQTPRAQTGSKLFGGTLSFEQHMQLEQEKAKMEERLQFELERETEGLDSNGKGGTKNRGTETGADKRGKSTGLIDGNGLRKEVYKWGYWV